MAQCLFGALWIELFQIGEQVHFSQQDQIGSTEDHRIFGRLVVPFCDREQGDIAVVAKVKTGGTDQIADILDKENVQGFKVHLMEGIMHHMGIKMAGASGRDLAGGDPLAADAVGIIFCFQVTLNHTNPQLIVECIDGRFQ